MQDDQSLIAELVTRGRVDQEQVADYSQEQIDDLCRSVAWQTYCDENIKVCAETAVEETGMGNVADKVIFDFSQLLLQKKLSLLCGESIFDALIDLSLKLCNFKLFFQ